ncbi:MAG: oligosaccharide flippase family protein, partial [Chloroflexota bacterium]|nr:oligosaccharide flippase family protein [Chloroflexota bacterium]
MVIISLLLAFGSPLYRLIFFDLPGFNQIHTPFRWLIPYTAAMAMLAGIGFDLVRASLPRWRWAFTAAALAGVFGLLPWARWIVPHVPASYHWLETRNYATFLALLVASAALTWLGRRAFAPLAIALVAADLAYFGINFNTAVSPKLLASTPPSIQFLQGDQDLFRVTAFGADKTFEPNGNLLYGLQDARGYDSVILARYAKFTELIEHQGELQFNRIASINRPSALDSPLLNLLNVKYVLSTRTIEAPRYRLVFDRPELKIYQNLAVLPRAFVVPNVEVQAAPAAQLSALSSPTFDPARTAIVDRPPASDITGGSFAPATIAQYSGRKVGVQATGPGLLVLSDNDFPGWKVSVDGRPAELYTADYTFRGVALGPGTHRVDFVFTPRSLILGGLGTGLSLALVALILGFYAWVGAVRRSPALQLQTASRVAKNSISPMASNVLTKLLSFGFTIYYFPVLGASQIGKYTLAVTIFLFMDTVISFGLQPMVMRDVARDKEAANSYITSAAAVRLAVTAAVGLPVIAGVLVLHRFFSFELDTTLVVIVLTLGFLPAAFSNIFSHVFDAFELMEYRAGINVLTGVMTVAFGLIFILAGWNIVGLAVASLLTNAIAAAVFYMLISRIIVRPAFHWDGRLARHLVAGAYPIMLNQLLVVLFFRVDVPILRAVRSNQEVGLYGTAYKFVDAMRIVPPAFIQAVFPILSRQALSRRESLQR